MSELNQNELEKAFKDIEELKKASYNKAIDDCLAKFDPVFELPPDITPKNLMLIFDALKKDLKTLKP